MCKCASLLNALTDFFLLPDDVHFKYIHSFSSLFKCEGQPVESTYSFINDGNTLKETSAVTTASVT